jgi:hypothetical protein
MLKSSIKNQIDDEKWKLVRRVKSGNAWHPTSDQLTGKSQYGT